MANKRRKRKMKKSSRIILSVLFFVVALIAALLTVPYFNISEISVTGISKLTEEEVIDASGIQTGNNVFMTDVKKAQRKIEALPYAANASVFRKFPARIEIRIDEAVLFAQVRCGDEYAGMDKNGLVLKKSQEPEEGVMTVEGLSPVKADEGERIEYESEDYYKIQDSLFNEIEKHGLTGKIKTVDFQNRSYITMSTESGLDVYIGTEEELDYKINYLAAILEQNYTSGVFDITNIEQPTFRKNR